VTSLETARLRRQMTYVRKDELADVILDVTRRIGGAGALLSALAEARNARAARRRRAARRKVA